MSDSVGGVWYIIRHWCKKADTQRPKCKDRNVLKPFYPNHQFKVCLRKVKCRGMTVGTCRCRLPCGLRVVLRLLDRWDRGFESRWAHGCSPVVFVMCCMDSGLCDELIDRSEDSYQVCVCVCVSNCVWSGNLKTRQPKPDFDCSATGKRNKNCVYLICFKT